MIDNICLQYFVNKPTLLSNAQLNMIDSTISALTRKIRKELNTHFDGIQGYEFVELDMPILNRQS